MLSTRRGRAGRPCCVHGEHRGRYGVEPEREAGDGEIGAAPCGEAAEIEPSGIAIAYARRIAPKTTAIVTGARSAGSSSTGAPLEAGPEPVGDRAEGRLP